MRKFIVEAAEAGQRADVYLARHYPEFSRSALENLFDNGLIIVGGKTAKAGQKLRAEDVMEVDDEVLRIEPAPIEIPVIYEDGDVVVMNKPVGVLTHSKGALNSEGTVASFLKPKITDKNLSGNRAGIVHRLDRPTSGVIIGAKHQVALKHLQKQFSTRKTKKTYVAIIEGAPEPAEAIIDAPIVRNPRRPQTFRVDAAGKPAQTHYKTLRTLEKNGHKYSELELSPKTGRTHQLRVHLAYINHPIVGDPIYGSGDGNLLLHAQALELTLPNGERKTYTSPLPERFKEFMG